MNLSPILVLGGMYSLVVVEVGMCQCLGETWVRWASYWELLILRKAFGNVTLCWLVPAVLASCRVWYVKLWMKVNGRIMDVL